MNSGNKGSPRPTLFLLSLLLIVGFALRVFLSQYWTYKGDFETWKWWAAGISKVGFSQFYDRYWCDYMPGYLYVLRLLEGVNRAFPKLPDEILFKLPSNISDLGISVLIYLTLGRITSLRTASLAALAYFFNPASLSNSTFWGQVDSVHALPLLLSVLLGLWGYLIPSAVFAGIAFMIKPQSLVVLPVLGLFVIWYVIERRKEGASAARAYGPGLGFFAAFAATVLILAMPFVCDGLSGGGFTSIFMNPVILVKERFFTAYDHYQFTSLNAFNLWGMLAMWKSDQIRFLGITYQRWGTILFCLFYALIFSLLFFSLLIAKFKPGHEIHPSKKGYLSMDGAGLTIYTFSAVTLVLFALFLFVTRVHERHFLPAVAFFAMIAFRSRRYWFFYLAVSLAYTFNLFYAYIELAPRVMESARPYLIVPASTLKPFIPGIVLLLLVIFFLVLLDFVRDSLTLYRRGTGATERR
ncbi:MAG TPA: hypothetical protein VNN20_08605 [Thermodesulfobacteriota bacterium]|nr:hypothetical protein [Thermodesulfobacteriota bacterium]